MSEPSFDELPSTSFGPPPQRFLDVHLEGDAVVDALDDLVARLKNVTSPKGAILRMIGVFHSAQGKSLLVQEEGQLPQQVQDLWR